MFLKQSETAGKPTESYCALSYSPPDVGRGAWRGEEISGTQHLFEGLHSSILISHCSQWYGNSNQWYATTDIEGTYNTKTFWGSQWIQEMGKHRDWWDITYLYNCESSILKIGSMILKKDNNKIIKSGSRIFPCFRYQWSEVTMDAS